MRSTKIGTIILAAGGSTRLGSPKQLLKFEGITLIRRAASSAIDAGCHPAIVVTGAASEDVRGELDGLDVHEIFNSEWQTGMASSIKAGLDSVLILEPQIDAVVVMLSDQPHVTAEVIKRLIEAYVTTSKPIAASSYGEDFGVPALFDKKHFDELYELEGDHGAKPIIMKHKSEVEFVDFPDGAIDIDTPDDLRRLTSRNPA